MLNHEIANIWVFSAYKNGNFVWFKLKVMEYGS